MTSIKRRLSIITMILLFFMIPISTYATQAEQTLEPVTTSITVNQVKSGSKSEQKKFKSTSILVPSNGIILPIVLKNKGLLELKATGTYSPDDIILQIYKDPLGEQAISTLKANSKNIYTWEIKSPGTYYLKLEAKNKEITQPLKTTFKIQTYSSEHITLTNKKKSMAYFKTKKSPVYLKYTAKSSGYFTLKSTKTATVRLYKNDKKSSLSDTLTLNKGNSYSKIFAVKKGTYYIKATSATKLVQVTPTFTTIKDTSGSKLSKAKTITLGKDYKTGLLTASDSTKSADWYRFKLSKTKFVTLNFIVYNNSGSFKIELFDFKKRPLASGGFSLRDHQSLTLNTPSAWQKGTYYIKISKNSKSSSGYYKVKAK